MTLFEVEGDGLVLLGGYSRESGLYHFPLAAVCPYTGADDVEPARLGGPGRLWLWTAVTTAPPGYEGPVPYGFGVVTLEQSDLDVVGRLTTAEVPLLYEGLPMRLVPDRFGDVTTWAFAPA